MLMKKNSNWLALGLAMTLVVAACGSDQSADSATTGETTETTVEATEEADGTPSRSRSSTCTARPSIESKPERVATVAWANHEVPLALGVVPVGMSKATWGDDDDDGVLPWVEDKLAELGAETPVLFDETDGIDFEAVADTEPDVILASYSGLTQEDYDTLSQDRTGRRLPRRRLGHLDAGHDPAELHGDGPGGGGRRADRRARRRGRGRARRPPGLAGKKIMFAYIDPADLSQIGFYTSHDTRPGFLADLGLPMPSVVAEESAETEEFYVQVSSEEADRFADVDVFVTYGDADGAIIGQIQADPLLSRSRPWPTVPSPSWRTRPRWRRRPTRRRCRSAGASTSTSLCSPAPASPAVSDRSRGHDRSPGAALAATPGAVRLAVAARRRASLASLCVAVGRVRRPRSSARRRVRRPGRRHPTASAQAAVARAAATHRAGAAGRGSARRSSGATMQAITRNPLADPGILGVSTGAALAVVSASPSSGSSEPVRLHLGGRSLGAAVAAVFVYAVGSLGAAARPR